MNRLSISAVLAFSLALAGAAPAAIAQQADATTHVEKHAHRHDPHRAAMHMSKQLGLTSDQTSKVEPILAERQQKIESLRADTTLTPQQRHDQMRTLQQSTRDQMASVLTPEQMEHLKSMHKEHRHHHDAPPAGA